MALLNGVRRALARSVTINMALLKECYVPILGGYKHDTPPGVYERFSDRLLIPNLPRRGHAQENLSTSLELNLFVIAAEHAHRWR